MRALPTLIPGPAVGRRRSRPLSTLEEAGRSRRRTAHARPSVLIIVQNLPVPLDRRVWQECQSLVAAGYTVSAICPKGGGDPAYELLDGVHLYKYAPPPVTSSTTDFIVEYAYCWLRTAALTVRVLRRHGLDVLQACNPPDTYFALAALLRPLGVRFVYDQHDLVPEMFFSRFGRTSGVLATGLRTFERLTYSLADRVIATNDSYAEVARSRGRLAGSHVAVVRSGPDIRRMRRRSAVPALRRGREHMAVWLGIMGPQDGVDLLLRAIHHYTHVLGRRDCMFAILGFGDAEQDLRALAGELDLDDHVVFTGRAGPEMIGEYLSTADLGLVPDPLTPYADLSTHNKTLEYMAHGLPVVAFDLKETRASAGPAAQYVPNDDTAAFAAAVADLLDRPARRRAMGQSGRQRVVENWAWHRQAPRYVAVYDDLLGRTSTIDVATVAPDHARADTRMATSP